MKKVKITPNSTMHILGLLTPCFIFIHDTEIAHFESYRKGFLLCMLFYNFISLNYMS